MIIFLQHKHFGNSSLRNPLKLQTDFPQRETFYRKEDSIRHASVKYFQTVLTALS